MVESVVESPTEKGLASPYRVPIRVLLVDDQADFLKAAKACLEMQGAFQVNTASSVEEATEKMKEESYDAIVSDYVMPSKDGFEFLKELRDIGSNIPFIIFTGKGREEIAIKALNLGADRYFTKVGDPETVYGELAYGIRQAVERRRAKDSQIESEEKWRILAEQSPNMIFVNKKGRVVYANKRCEEIMGYKREEFYSEDFSFFSLIAPESIDMVKSSFSRHMKGLEIPPFEYTLVTREGRRIEAMYSSKLIRYQGETAILGTVVDITQRKRAEEALKKSEEKYRTVVEHSLQGIVIVQDFRIVYANKAFAKISGYTVKELLSLSPDNVREMVHPEDQAFVWGRFEDRLKGKVVPMHYEYRGVRKDGKVIWLEMFAHQIEHNGKPAVQGAIIDITESKRSEQELEQSRRHFKELFDAMVDPVVIVDGKGKILEVTRRVKEVTGFERDELLGKNFLRTKTMTAKSKAKTLKNLAKRMMGMHVTPYEVEVLTKDGRKMPYEINATKIEYKGKPADLVAFRDISERKKMEEKLRVVGRLTRHDVRNKLSILTMNLYMIKQKLADDHGALEHLKEIESACEHVERIFDFDRVYEKLGLEKLVYIDVGEILGEAVSLFSDLQGAKVLNICGGLEVLADSLLRQLFYNLIHNSLQHGEGVTKIRVHYEETDEDRLNLVYEDDGVGIPKADKEKIFQEGWGKGTGYGLYLIRKMCEVYGWTIQETGKPGKGAQFTITMPKIDQSGKIKYRLRAI